MAAGGARRWAGAVVEVAAWWAVCEGVWALTLSALTTPELVVAASCGLPCAVVARASRRTLRMSWRPDPRWVWWLVPLTAAIVTDTVRLFALVLRPGPVDGRLEPVRLPAEPAARANARGALASVTLTSTPGSYVLDADTGDADLLLHRLIDGGPDLTKVVSR